MTPERRALREREATELALVWGAGHPRRGGEDGAAGESVGRTSPPHDGGVGSQVDAHAICKLIIIIIGLLGLIILFSLRGSYWLKKNIIHTREKCVKQNIRSVCSHNKRVLP